MQPSSTAPGNSGNSRQARGGGDQTPRGRGAAPRGRGRGRGGNSTSNSGEGPHRSRRAGTGRPRGVSLREHASASIIPLERRRRIYLPLDKPPQREGTSSSLPSGQLPLRNKSQEESMATTESGDAAVQTPPEQGAGNDHLSSESTINLFDPLRIANRSQEVLDNAEADNVKAEYTGADEDEAEAGIWPRPVYIQRFQRPRHGAPETQPEVPPPSERKSTPPLEKHHPQDPDDLLIFDDDPTTGTANAGDLIDFGED
ncbi:MAG: hypothetical protein Q9188_004935 [Gyalolechia gomerana]